ncbi:MAG: prepilin-type N-terminal cleavage/methylation domain-containing protein [Candidatus Muiribacteriota bacterium]
MFTQKAYSLIEVLVSIVIFMLLVTPVFYLRTTGGQIAFLSSEEAYTQRYLINISEVIKETGFDNLSLSDKIELEKYNFIQQSNSFPEIKGFKKHGNTFIEVIKENRSLKKITISWEDEKLSFRLSPLSL